jgi:ketosteroid isomerase-like protein
MSQENVEWMRQLGEAWDRGDIEAVEALVQGRLAADFAFDPVYLDRVYSGVEGMRQMWADMTGTWDDYRSEMEEVIDLGEHVLVLTHITARGAGGGVPIDQRIAILGRFQGDKLVSAKSFASKAEALAAVGLRE